MRARWFVVFVAALVANLSPGASRGANLSLSGDNVVWNPSAQPSPQFVVSVSNDTATDPPADLLTGYQLLLQLVPTVGASGALHFASTSVPPGYLLTGNSLGPFPTIGPLDTLFIFDSIDVGGDEVQVPLGPTPLTRFDFSSVGASGLFEVYALDSPTGTQWGDADFDTRYFAGLPNGGSPLLLGTVLVVPEPSTWALAVAGLLGLALLRTRRRVAPGLAETASTAL